MDEKLQQVGRLALRREGKYWNAYYAAENTMDGAILLGSILMSVVERDKPMKEAFMGLMRSTVSLAFEGSLGRMPEWKEPQRAPENERAGHS